MIVALLTILLLGGGTTNALLYIGDTQDAVKTVMPKGNEQKAALSTLKAMKKRTNAHNKMARKTVKQIGKAFKDHDTSAGDVDAIWATYFEEVSKHNNDMLDLRFELKESISREEWAAIFQGPE
jgi:hypothetical protein